jgi:hypothetical protein
MPYPPGNGSQQIVPILHPIGHRVELDQHPGLVAGRRVGAELWIFFRFTYVLGQKSHGVDSLTLAITNRCIMEATIQAVLLFGSETWKLFPSSLKSLEGFHIQAARCMAGKMPTQNPDGTWTYPSSKDVLKAVGLWTTDHYIGVCWETIARFIVDQPLFVLYREGEKRGSVRCTFWWEQPLSIDGAESLPGDNKDKGDDTGFCWGQSVWLELLVWVVLNPY